MTAYALGVVIGAPGLPALATSWPRKSLLLVAMVLLLTLGNAVVSLSGALTPMLVARFASGLGRGVFLAVASSVATQLAGIAPARLWPWSGPAGQVDGTSGQQYRQRRGDQCGGSGRAQHPAAQATSRLRQPVQHGGQQRTPGGRQQRAFRPEQCDVRSRRSGRYDTG